MPRPERTAHQPHASAIADFNFKAAPRDRPIIHMQIKPSTTPTELTEPFVNSGKSSFSVIASEHQSAHDTTSPPPSGHLFHKHGNAGLEDHHCALFRTQYLPAITATSRLIYISDTRHRVPPRHPLLRALSKLPHLARSSHLRPRACP